MPKPHRRPDRRRPLEELIALREQKFPGTQLQDIAAMLGITRMHLWAVEQGRRLPSMELALRWLALLAPEARMSMFGPLPEVERRLQALKQLKEISPETFQAA